MAKVIVEQHIVIQHTFNSEDDKHNAAFIRQIQRWTKETLKNEVSQIPFVENSVEYIARKKLMQITTQTHKQD